MKYRQERLTKVFEEELSSIIEKELEFPDSLVTITRIDFTSKLDRATIGFSIYPSEKAEDALKTLNKNKLELRKLLSKKVTMKTMPQLEFEIDHGSENAARVEKLIMEDNNK